MAGGKKGFGKYTILRVMKENLPSDIIIKNEVKEGMETFLEHIIQSVCNNIDRDMSIIDYNMFEKATKPYTDVSINQTTDQKHLKYLDKIISDCETMKTEITEKYN